MKSYEINVITDTPKSNTQFNQTTTTGAEFDQKVKVDSDNSKLVKVAMIGLAKQTASNVISRIGDYTGRREQQQRVENVMKFANAGVNIYMGFKVGGVYGAIAGAAVSGYQFATEIVDNNYNISQQEKQRVYLRSLAGNINSHNRSNGVLW